MLIERARERQKISARGDDEVAQKTFVMKRSQGGNSSELPGYLHYLLGNQIDITHTHARARARSMHGYCCFPTINFNMPTGAGAE